AYVVDPKTSGILSPAKYFNKSVTDVYSLLAIKKVVEAKEEQISVYKSDDVYVVAQPVYLYSQEAGDRVLQVIVMAIFQMNDGITSTFEPLVEATLFSVLMSLGAFFLIYKMFTYPLTDLQEQLDSALKGEASSVQSDVKFPELQSLATVMNFSVSRARGGGGGAMGMPAQGDDGGNEDAIYIQTVREFEAGSSDGILLIDSEKKIKFVG